MTTSSSLEGWTPVRVHWRGEPIVEWCWMEGLSFTDPFFSQTIERALRRPFSLLFRRETGIEALGELAPGLDPSGFVFHVSRCGSTLVTQMLAAVPHHLVLSEPLPVDHVLRLPAPEEDRVRWLRQLVSVLGTPRLGNERGYVIKFDAWNTMMLGTIRQAFPDVPWLFLVRDPLEVLASQVRHRGAHMVPGALDPRLFDLDLASVETMPWEEYAARVYGAICTAALRHRDAGMLVADYSELPEALFERVLGVFRLTCDPAEWALMREVSGNDAKNPSIRFDTDRAAHQPRGRDPTPPAPNTQTVPLARGRIARR